MSAKREKIYILAAKPEPVPAPSIELDEILQEDLDVAIDAAEVEAERRAELAARIARFSGENCPICGAELQTIETHYKAAKKASDVLYGCKNDACFYQRKIYAGQSKQEILKADYKKFLSHYEIIEIDNEPTPF